ncbi:MAG: Na+/H+ antiporter subunit E [Geminicoccaceae bacterium]|nr:Na+/H+ antiporter subunit E [Geminicoccaceae bacterium]
MLQAVSLTAALSILWLLLSGYWDNHLILALGAGSVVVSVIIAWRMRIVDREGHPAHLALRGIIYWPWLIKEIVVANIDVAKAILGIGGGKVEPMMFSVRASQATDLGRVIYANSITLTPGTVTVALDDEHLVIHALTQGAMDGLATGEMDRRVCELVGER